MGTAIEEALNYMPCLMEACSHCLVRGCDKPVEKIDEAKIVAIDTMHKYQQIQKIVNKWHHDIEAKDFECMAEIAEVVENGNDD